MTDLRWVQGVRRIVAEMLSGQPIARWGTVQSIDAGKQAVRVLLQPEGIVSGWLPLIQPAASGGWGVTALPAPGDMAFVIPEGVDARSGVVVGFAHNDGATPPTPPNSPGSGGTPSTGSAAAVSGEVVLRHQSGSTIRLCADGTIYSRGTWNHDGNMTVNGTVAAQQDITTPTNVRAGEDVMDWNNAHGGIKTLRDAYNAHEHPVQNIKSGSDTVNTKLTDHLVP